MGAGAGAATQEGKEVKPAPHTPLVACIVVFVPPSPPRSAGRKKLLVSPCERTGPRTRRGQSQGPSGRTEGGGRQHRPLRGPSVSDLGVTTLPPWELLVLWVPTEPNGSEPWPQVNVWAAGPCVLRCRPPPPRERGTGSWPWGDGLIERSGPRAPLLAPAPRGAGHVPSPVHMGCRGSRWARGWSRWWEHGRPADCRKWSLEAQSLGRRARTGVWCGASWRPRPRGAGEHPWLSLSQPGGPAITGPVSLGSGSCRPEAAPPGGARRCSCCCRHRMPVLDAEPLREWVGVLGEGTHCPLSPWPPEHVHQSRGPRVTSGQVRAPSAQGCRLSRWSERTRLPLYEWHS